MAIPRNELKFYINSASAPMLFPRLSAALPMDRHTRVGGEYKIRSLYFEDPLSSCFYDKINGLEKRNKYRIRFYNSDLSYLRLEKKAKQGKMCLKSFEVIDLDSAEKLLSPMPDLQGGDLVQEVNNSIRYGGFRPLLFVDYRRSAFLHPAGNVRITLDRDVCASRFVSELSDNHVPIPVLQEGMSVLEVKYDDFLPPYISRLLEDIPKIQCSVSKFCLCAQALF